jgi:hypothetical protein
MLKKQKKSSTSFDLLLFNSCMCIHAYTCICEYLYYINSPPYEWHYFFYINSRILFVRAADQSVPKIHFDQSKSYPPHIISLIKERREVRRDRKRVTFENKPILSTEYNRLTSLIKKSIKEYTEWKWSLFLGKLGPHPPSSSLFWKIINRARSPKRTSSIPNLVVGDRVYSSDEEKANLFRSILGETFTDSGPTTDFESVIYNYVEEFVSNFDYSDENFSKVSFVEMVK